MTKISRIAVASLAVFIAGFAALSPLHASTVYTGDRIQGIPVISALDVDDLQKGKTHRFLFQGVEMGTGQHWYVPVMVVKGASDGKKVLLIAGVHGDELSPVAVVQKSLAALDPMTLSGTVIGVFDLSRASKEQVQRKWPVTENGGSLADLNRAWPGIEYGSPAQRQAWLVWNRLFKDNVDLSLDFHTAASGSDFALFIFADYRRPGVRTLAELFPVAQIKDDPGLTGTLETALVHAGIPAITVEVGGPRSFDRAKIDATAQGVANVLSHHGVTPTPIGRTSHDSKPYFGNDMEAIHATTGGYAELLVDIGDKVSAGQKVAIQRNSFGDLLREYHATVDGEVSIVGRDALRESGALLVAILTTSRACENGCAYDDDY